MQTLIVIDDEPGIGFTLQQVLANEQLRVHTAATAETGLELVRQETPDVVLLDVRLGHRSGLELFHQLRAIDSKLLVIFITGHGTTDTAIEAMKIGAFDYLVKPLDLTLLQQTVERGKQGALSERKSVRLGERFQWFLAPALLLLLWSYWHEFPVSPKPRDLRRA